MSDGGLCLCLPDRDVGRSAMRRLLASLGLLLLTLGIWLPAPAARAAEPSSSASSRFGACLARAKQADLILLVDESASLKTNDPGHGRVTASEHLMRGLADLAKQGVTVNVRVDTFSTSYANGSGWTVLTEQSLPGVLGQVSALAGRQQGTGTDYWLALDGARLHLAERAAAGSTCQAVLFFSDGEMDIDRAPGEDDYTVASRPYDPSNKLGSAADRARANQRATESLCRPGGLADQLRSAGVILFGIGLQGPNPGRFDLMRSIVTGNSPTGRCGSISDPVPGDFYVAGSVGDLLLAFTQVNSPGRITERDVCQGDVCPEGVHSFVLDPSVGRVDIVATSSGSGQPPQVILIDPTGAQITVPTAAGDQKLPLPQTVGMSRWLEPRTVAITLVRDGSAAWTGQWQVGFVDPAKASAGSKSKTSLRIVGDVRPVWRNADSTGTWRQGGDPVDLQIGLVDGSGQPIEPTAILGTMQLAVDVVSSRGSQRLAVLDQTSVSAPVRVDPTTVGLDVTTLSLSLDITTKATTDPQGRPVSGTALATQRVDSPVSVLAPPGYPTIGSGPIHFGSAEGPANLNASLPVTGPGCVWLGSHRGLAGPDQVSWEVTSPAHSPETCITVAEGATGALPLTLTSKQAGNGGVSGEVTIFFAPAEKTSDPRQVTVAYHGSLFKPLNQTSFVLAFLAALLLGPGIPLGLLYLFRYLVAARIPGESLMVTMIPVSLVDGRLLRDGVPLAPRPDDLSQILAGTGKPLRSIDIGSGIVLRACSGWSPFTTPYVQVVVPDAVGVSDSHQVPMPKTGYARLPVAVQNHWVLLQRLSDPADQATLILIAGVSASSGQRQELYDTAADGARRSFQALATARPGQTSPVHTAVPSGEAPTPANPFVTPGATGSASPVPSGGPVSPVPGSPARPFPDTAPVSGAAETETGNAVPGSAPGGPFGPPGTVPHNPLGSAGAGPAAPAAPPGASNSFPDAPRPPSPPPQTPPSGYNPFT